MRLQFISTIVNLVEKVDLIVIGGSTAQHLISQSRFVVSTTSHEQSVWKFTNASLTIEKIRC